MPAQSIPHMFFERAAARGERPAQLSKRAGRWEALSWQELSHLVRRIATGLLALEVQLGDRIALLSESRPQWVQCDLGILAVAGITVPIYPSSTDDQTAYILDNAEVTRVFVDTPERLARLMRVRARVPTLRRIIVMTTERPQEADPMVLSLDDLMAWGDAAADQATGLAGRLEHLAPDREATYVYTSGTTGPPKGVVQTHGNHLAMLQSTAQVMEAQEGDVNLLFLPLAHSFARLEEFLGLYVGLTTAFAESLDALAQNMREVRPMLVFGVPRVYEKIYARITDQGTSGAPLKRAIFRWSVGVGRQVSALRQSRQPVPAWLRMQYALAHRLVFRKLHQAVGGRLRYFVSGGAPLAKDIAEFFHAAGILILEGYGLTETCPALTANRYDHYKFGTVGQALPGVELRLADDGEILARGANIAEGYYKRPEDTAAVFLEDGWFATGDIGELDTEGFLRLTDRKKDLLITAGGKNVAPQNVENHFKTDRYISQVMVYGDRRKYLTAVITLDLDTIIPYAHEHHISFDSPQELTTHPHIQALLERRVARLNQGLAPYETIKKFVIAPTDFTPESDELTPTLKVKRQVVLRKYQSQLDRLYAEETRRG
jgi:long-chain acyl-CoA synthetase